MISCPRCNSVSLRLDGMGHTDEQHYRCKNCDHHFNERTLNSAKILVFDIENAPVEAYTWNKRLWNTNINKEQLKHDWYMLTWCAKWLNDSEMFKNSIKPSEAKKRNDKRIVKKLWHLFDQADVIIAHNAWGFDIPMVNTRFITLGMKPPSPYRVIDTLRVSKKIGSFTYNSLDYLGQVLKVGKKKDTNFQLWVDCMSGQKKALKTMLDYNAQDVLLLEEVYLKFRGWMKSHPNMNSFQQGDGCSNCGSLKIHPKGYYRTQVSNYRSFQCDDCGGYSREARKTKVSIAR